MSIVLSFRGQDILDGIKASHLDLLDALERTGKEILSKGGTVRIEDEMSADKQNITILATYENWLREFRRRHNIMSLEQVMQKNDLTKPSGTAQRIPTT